MSADRDAVQRALQEILVPALRERGFKGMLPHFRRLGTGQAQLLTVQFNKWGGSFIIELGRAQRLPYRSRSGRVMTAGQLRAWDLDLEDRVRLHAGATPRREVWFSFKPGLAWWRNADRFQRAARQALAKLPEADAWWAGEPAPTVMGLGRQPPAGKDATP